MSVTSKPYGGEVVSQGIITKFNFMENELKHAPPLNHDNIKESLTVNEEIIVSANGHLPGKVDCQTQSTVYFEEDLETCDDTPARFDESIDIVPLSDDSSITEKWDCENVEAPISKEDEIEDDEDDEETIATFVTAAGQQLALYAVEDSDEIFAVAVYDESDEPPTNFQFLMKSDVERLIGEGAVRTVKKPSQMKKRVFTAKPPMLCRKEEANDKTSICDTLVNGEKNIAQEDGSRIVHNYETYQNCSDKINLESSDSVHTVVDEQSDITYLMMNDNFVNIAEQPDECEDNIEFEDELIEHSTVQYILLEADHESESELTFDDIQATLQNMKISREKSLETNDKKSDKLQDDYSSIQQDSRESSIKEESSFSEDADAFELYMSPQSTIDRTCVSVSEDDRQRLIDTLTDSPPSTTKITSQTPLKVKRSRKQQLISVDRDDGEIIIQPASMMNDESIGKKRTTRRRRLPIRVAMVNRKGIKRTRRIKRPKRRKVVEVIDLDVDEEEQQTTRNVVEITLDDNKDKCSSDKENEIIMVRDSDSSSSDHEENEKTEWTSGRLTKLNGETRCEYCSRNFRYRRTLNMHLLVCQKVPTNALNLDKGKPKGKINKKINKQFTCKICQEKFDAVVVLARHVRLVHVPRKKNELSLSSEKSSSKSLRSIRKKEPNSTEEEESDDEDDTTEKELSMLARVKRKRKQRNNYSESKKLDCAECGRWFPSTTLLNAHCLQHGIKRSEQLRKCHICKKYIKSRLLFLQHLRMHNDTQRTSGSSSNMVRRKLHGRPSTRKIASPRKRGRPRKF
ncbi:ZN384 protein, partial [Pseudoatta argentina]